MGEVFNTHAEGLARTPSKLLVGIGIEEASHAEPDLAVLYADVGKRFGLEAFQNHGGFCLDVGIAEQSLIGVAAGMSHEGFLPVAITYAPFLSGRVFDQIKANIGQMGLPMVLMGATSGFAGGDLGPLLMCTDDMAMLRTIPNLTIVSPADGIETVKCIVSAVQQKKQFYIRLTGGKTLAPVYTEDYSFQIGKAVELREGNRVAVIGTGAILTGRGHRHAGRGGAGPVHGLCIFRHRGGTQHFRRLGQRGRRVPCGKEEGARSGASGCAGPVFSGGSL